MSTIATVFSFVVADRTGTLQVIIDEVPATEYVIDASTVPVTVSISALDEDATLDLAGWTGFLGDLSAFKAQCVRLYTPTDGEATGIHMRRINVRSNRIDSDMTIDGETIVDARWTESTNQIVFQARPAFSLTWNQFGAWVDFLHAIRQAISEF